MPKRTWKRCWIILIQLNELDTTGIEPMSHVFPVHNVFREDVVTNGDESEKVRWQMHRQRKDDAFR